MNECVCIYISIYIYSMWAYNRHFQLQIYLWLMEGIANRFIQLAIMNHENVVLIMHIGIEMQKLCRPLMRIGLS